jgi:hypothetical protein
VRIAVSVPFVAMMLAGTPVLAREQTVVEDTKASEKLKLDFDPRTAIGRIPRIWKRLSASTSLQQEPALPLATRRGHQTETGK